MRQIHWILSVSIFMVARPPHPEFLTTFSVLSITFHTNLYSSFLCVPRNNISIHSQHYCPLLKWWVSSWWRMFKKRRTSRFDSHLLVSQSGCYCFCIKLNKHTSSACFPQKLVRRAKLSNSYIRMYAPTPPTGQLATSVVALLVNNSSKSLTSFISFFICKMRIIATMPQGPFKYYMRIIYITNTYIISKW